MELQPQLLPIIQPVDNCCARALVLIAEDEPLLAEYMACAAQSHGCEVRIAASTLEFDDVVKQAAPDVIITDLAMPERDGVELMRFLAEVGYGGPVLIISACDERVIDTSVMLGREMGLNVAAAAQKPITDAHLTEILTQALNGLV